MKEHKDKKQIVTDHQSNPDDNKIEIERGKPDKSSNNLSANKKEEPLETTPETGEETIDSQKLVERLNELEEINKDLNDRLLRRAAEFENYKRRSENDLMNLLKYASEPFIIKILPIYDDIQRSLAHADDENNSKSLKEGLRLILDKFTKTLEEQGVKKIQAKGSAFDFNYHEALMQQESKDVAPHTVLEEIEPGYFYKDKVIRHAKVIVSQEPHANESNSSEEKK